jgi:hypothetical protein
MGRKANTLEIEQLALPWNAPAEEHKPPRAEEEPARFVPSDEDLPSSFFEEASCAVGGVTNEFRGVNRARGERRRTFAG